jgi:hypothetical protein
MTVPPPGVARHSMFSFHRYGCCSRSATARSAIAPAVAVADDP